MKQIYLDREQCNDFGISYYEKGAISLPADVILRSKGTGYDRAHQDFLKPLGRSVVRLWKLEADAPGWYNADVS